MDHWIIGQMDSYLFRFLVTYTILLLFLSSPLSHFISADFSLLCRVSLNFFSINWVYWTCFHETQTLMVVITKQTWFTSSWPLSFFYWREEKGKPYSHRLVISYLNKESNKTRELSRLGERSDLDPSDIRTSMGGTGRSKFCFLLSPLTISTSFFIF